MRSSVLGLLLALIANVAEASITFQGAASSGADTASVGTYQAWTITPGGSGAAAGDLCVLDGSLDGKGTSAWPTISVTGGQTWNTLFQSETSTYARARYWTVFNGTWTGGTITITSNNVPSGAFAITGILTCFHPTNATYTWSVDVSTSQSEYSAPGGSCDVTVTGQTPTSMASVVTLVNWMDHGNDTWALQTAGWTNPSGSTQIRNSYAGAHLSLSQAYKIQSSASATGNVTNRESTCNAGWTAITTFKETAPGGGGTGFTNRFVGFFGGTFARDLGGSGGSPPTSPVTQWNPGVYGDCLTETAHGGDEQVAIGNEEYLALIACMDYWATQTPTASGVFFEMTWDSFEGDTPGCYDSSCSNVMSQGATGKIGFALLDDLLAYAASKSLKVLIGISWTHIGGYGGCHTGTTYSYNADAYFPLYLLHTGTCGGTDAAGTYGLVFDTNAIIADLWKPAVMDRYIALLQAYGARYDTNTALEEIVLMTEEGSYGNTAAMLAAGYSSNALGVQQARTPALVKPSWPHTNVVMGMQWIDPTSNGVTLLNAGNSSAAQAIGYYQNDLVPSETQSGAAMWVGYIGACAGGGTPCWGNTSTHNFAGQLPMTIKPSDELCGGLPAGHSWPYYTPQQFWDATYTTGTAEGAALKASHVIISRTHGPNYCPTDVTQQWGTTTSGGWKQFLQTHSIPAPAVNCPTAYTGGCAP